MGRVKKLHRMTDPVLIDTTRRLCIVAQRDVAALAELGWTAARIDALRQAMLDLLEMPTDVELLGMKMEASAEKRKARRAIYRFVQKEVMLRAAQAFGKGSWQYNYFRMSKLKAARQLEFYHLSKRALRLATGYLAQLGPLGLTPAKLQQLTDLIEDYHLAQEAEEAAIDARSEAVDTRLIHGNALYTELLSLSTTGKGVGTGSAQRYHLSTSGKRKAELPQ